MIVIPFGSIILLRLEQPPKALHPICITLSGIVISIMFWQQLNALSPILVIHFSNTIEPLPLTYVLETIFASNAESLFILTIVLSDVLYSIISLGLESGVDIQKSLDDVLIKYQKRIDEKKNMGSGR